MAISPTPEMGLAGPPETGTRHKVRRPPLVEENTISPPSGVQAGVVQELSKVSCLGTPPDTGTTNTSPKLPEIGQRMKATCDPSGENAASRSPCWSGAIVNCLLVKSLSESKTIFELWYARFGSLN